MGNIKILVILVAVLCCGPLFSDSLPESPSYKHELQFKLGPAPGVPLALSIFAFSYNQVIVPENIMFLAIPAFMVEYLYNLTPRHAIGASATPFSACFPPPCSSTASRTGRPRQSECMGLWDWDWEATSAIPILPYN